ncbi:hypothetical protein JHK82_031240 [Glycine max]|uniref:Uncharacterized protein n=2 Tax=Glycine subgen. Soja TaxID=1462606 RepID=K7LQ81_SOYBN|nr:hypothetical protein JHK87_031164 [Glycine soja]KAG4988908.1 hypothetical protein JHK85_031891 [Glycine max]KAG4994506.1 hypothetical protein JHK86_031333 [Glycine max]KAG5124503.1 hypothetical protein JHK82_031240 [Glycine max]KAG5145931.1 hypothetical protein JHK84_031474 [Glycine max]
MICVYDSLVPSKLEFTHLKTNHDQLLCGYMRFKRSGYVHFTLKYARCSSFFLNWIELIWIKSVCLDWCFKLTYTKIFMSKWSFHVEVRNCCF